jgi:5-hydroxyisourate hydrolase-like protein (transthyretin family)
VRAFRRTVLALLLVGWVMPAATAGAGTYTVYTCKAPDGSKAGIPWTHDKSLGFGYFTGDACPGGYIWMDLVSNLEHPSNNYIRLDFRAPPAAQVTAYRLWRSVQLSDPYSYDFHEIDAAGGRDIKEHCFGRDGCTSLGSFQNGTEAANLVQASGRTGVAGMAFSIYCRTANPGQPACPPAAPAVNFQLHRAEITVDDPHPPVLALPPTGPLVDSSGPLSGEQQVFVWATDRGGGVRDVLFEVDGRVVSQATVDDNDGHCRDPFVVAQPCKSEVRGTATFNTALVPDGRHRLRLLVTDATGTNSTAWGPINITTANGTCNPQPRSEALRVRAAIVKRSRVVRYGRRLRVRGRVTRPDGTPASGVPVCIAARNDSPQAPLRTARTVTTGADGRFADVLRRGPSRRVYFVVRLPDGAASASVLVKVRAGVRLRTSRRHLFNGQVLRFRGAVRGRPIPRRGVLVELQVLERRGWQTFATTRANRKRRFRFAYRFTNTTQLRRYRFRARVPVQAAYPYAAGGSRPVSVTVQG